MQFAVSPHVKLSPKRQILSRRRATLLRDWLGSPLILLNDGQRTQLPPLEAWRSDLGEDEGLSTLACSGKPEELLVAFFVSIAHADTMIAGKFRLHKHKVLGTEDS